MPEKNSPSKEKPTGSVKKQNDPDNVTSNTNLAPNKDDKSPKPGKPKKDDKKSAKPGETKKDDKKSSKPPDPVVHSIQSKNILPEDPKKSGTNKPDPITRPVGASDVVANIPLKDGRVCKPVPPLAIASPPSKSTVKKKPWKRCPNICKFFGTFDEFHLMTWKTAFDRKMELGDVGIGVKKSIDFRYLFKTDVPKDRDSKNQKMKGGSPPQGENEPLEVIVGLPAYNQYSKLNKDQGPAGGASGASKPEGASKREGASKPAGASKPEDSVSTKATLKAMTKKELLHDEKQRILRDMSKASPGLLRHRPWFTIILSCCQLLYLLVALGSGGFERCVVGPSLKTVDDVQTVKGTVQVKYWVGGNPWAGPPLLSLVALHAAYAPCMRNDRANIYALQQMNRNYKVEIKGCCFTTVESNGEKTNISFPSKESRCKGVFRKESCDDAGGGDESRLWPCCFGMRGQCRLTFESDCKAHKGHYIRGKSHCLEVNCMKKICGGWDIEPHPKIPHMIDGHAQGWRWLTGAVLHAGIIHFLIVLILQWFLLRCLETLVGFLRTAILFFVTMLGSNMIGAYYNPYMPVLGGTPLLFAVLTINFVEILQGWRKLSYPIPNLVAVLVLMVILLFIGSFPLISNFSQVAGIWFGFFTGMAIMPHMNFGKFRTRVRRLIVLISVFVVVVSYLWLLLDFYHIQNTSICKGCETFECLPYTDEVCKFRQGLLDDDVE